MTGSFGNVVKDDDKQLSQYKTNIVLSDSLTENEKDRKILWVKYITSFLLNCTQEDIK